jgi:hypothetical protein
MKEEGRPLNGGFKLRRFRTIIWLAMIVLVACVSFYVGKRMGAKEGRTFIHDEIRHGHEHAYRTYKKLKLLASAHISKRQLFQNLDGDLYGVMETLSYSRFPHAPEGYTHAVYDSKSLYVFFLRFADKGLMDCAWGGLYCGPR